MARTLLEIDQRSMENLMTGPHVVIEETGETLAGRVALFNKAGFAAHAGLVDAQDCDGFSIEVEDIAEGRLTAQFAPDFGPIRRRDAIRRIGILGSGRFAPGFDLDSFRQFDAVRGLATQGVPFGPALPALFPRLEAWLNLDCKANPPARLQGGWPELRHLSLQGFSGSLAGFEGAPLRRLFLIGATIKDIAELLRFARLEVLQLVACRVGGDVSALAGLPRLRALRIEGRTKLTGWEAFGSATLEDVELSHCPCRFPAENFPRLWNHAVNTYRPRDPFRAEGGDAAGLASAFSSIFP